MATKIEWVQNPDGTKGDTWNPIRSINMETGKIGHHCEKISAGCANCYASTMQPRLFGHPQYPAHKASAPTLPVVDSDGRVQVGENQFVYLDEKVLTQPLRWRKPRPVFVCSMTDLFASFVPDDWIIQMFSVMSQARDNGHTFQVLTKRSARMRDFMNGCSRTLPNVWLGVSCENQATADERIPRLFNTPAAVRWVSAEPLLGPIDFDLEWLAYLDWVVVGGESGPKARPCAVEWIRGIRDQCKRAGVRVFVKQLGSNAHYSEFSDFPDGPLSRITLEDSKGGDPSEWPKDLRVREFPK